MPYLGNDLSTIVKQGKKVYEYVATAGQTAFTGSDSNGESLNITVNSFVAVFLNGIRLIVTDDYTVSTNTITLTSAASLNDELIIVADIEASVFNTYTQSETDAEIVSATADKAPINNPEFTGEYIKIPAGTTAQRPTSPSVGMLRYNTTLGFTEQYTVDGWQGIAPPPSITGTDVNNIDESDSSQVIVINGTTFDPTSTAVLIDANGTTRTPTTSVRNSSTQITITFSGGDVLDETVPEPLDVKVSNGSGLSATLEDAISIDATPVWTTAAGNIGTVYEDQVMSTITLVSNDPEGSNVTYSISSGALPAGLSFNTSTGEITGTPNVNDSYSASGVTHNFTVDASDGTGNTTPRSFNIVRKWMDGTTQTQAAPSGQAIADLGITTDGTYWIKPPGGSGTAVQAYVLNSIHGGGWVKFIQYYGGNTIGNQTAAYNTNAAWTSYLGGMNYGKLANSDIHALQSNGTNTAFLMSQDTHQKYRYFRYVEGPAITGHHPRCSRIGFRDIDGNDRNIIVYTSDNCNDVGTYQVGTTGSIDVGAGNETRATAAFIYSSFGGGTRSAYFTLQGSNNNSSWDNLFSGEMQSVSCGIKWGQNYDYRGYDNSTSQTRLDPLFNMGRGIGGFFLSSGTLTNFGTDMDPTATYDLKLDRERSGTWNYSVTYTNDTRGRCGHTGIGSGKVWVSDHNYNGTPGSVNGVGIPHCFSIGPNGVGTNLHWMSQAEPNLVSGNVGQSDGEMYWGTNTDSSFALWIK